METINSKIRNLIKSEIMYSGTNSVSLDDKLNDIDFVKEFGVKDDDNLSKFVLSLLGQGCSL